MAKSAKWQRHAKTFGHSFACTQPNDSDEIQCLGFGGIANREMAHRLEGITNVSKD